MSVRRTPALVRSSPPTSAPAARPTACSPASARRSCARTGTYHTIQTVEAAFRQFEDLRGAPAGTHVLVAAARYLAAHAPTVRAQDQTLQIARRLHHGERLYEDV